MSLASLPAYAVGLFGLLFIAAGVLAPWFSRSTGSSRAADGERALLFALGGCLTSLWSVWHWLV